MEGNRAARSGSTRPARVAARRSDHASSAAATTCGSSWCPASAPQPALGLGAGQRLAVRAVGRHHVPRVAGEDDARRQRDVLAGQPVRIARRRPSARGRAHGARRPAGTGCRAGCARRPRVWSRTSAHSSSLSGPAGEDLVRDRDLADVVQARRRTPGRAARAAAGRARGRRRRPGATFRWRAPASVRSLASSALASAVTVDRYAPSSSSCSRLGAARRRRCREGLERAEHEGRARRRRAARAPRRTRRAVGDRLEHAQPAAGLALRWQLDAELRDQPDRIDVELRPAAREGRGRARGRRAGAAEQVAGGGDEAGARAFGQQHGGEHGVGHAGRALGRVAHRRLDVGRCGRLGGGAGEQLLARQRLAVRAARVVRREHERERLRGLREERVGAGANGPSRRKAIRTPWSSVPATSGAPARRARPGRADGDPSLVRLVVVDPQRAARPARPSRPARRRRSGCRRSAACAVRCRRRAAARGRRGAGAGRTARRRRPRPASASRGGDGGDLLEGAGASTRPAIRDSAANWSAPETMVFCIAQTGGALESRARSILPRLWLSP